MCGEYVSAEALNLITSLLPSAQRAPWPAGEPAIRRVRIFIDNHCVSLRIAPPALAIPRFQLDRLLWDAARAAGVVCMDKQAVISARDNGNEYETETSQRKFRSRVVVDATGRWSELRHNGATSSPRYLGIKAHFRETPIAAHSCDLHFLPGGYCGVQPVGPDLVNVSALMPEGSARSLADLFPLSDALYQRSRCWHPVTETLHTFPVYFHKPEPVKDGILRIGDAAGFMDPFAGDGISLAVHSGRLAAKHLRLFLQNQISLEQSFTGYAEDYQCFLLPAFRAARLLRKLMNAPSFLRRMGIRLAHFPFLTTHVVTATRARIS